VARRLAATSLALKPVLLGCAEVCCWEEFIECKRGTGQTKQAG
jgi:hypothetical protein